MQKIYSTIWLLGSAKQILKISTATFVASLPVVVLVSFIFMFPAIKSKSPYFQQTGTKFGPLSNAIDMFSLVSLFAGFCFVFSMALVIGAEIAQSTTNDHATRKKSVVTKNTPSRSRLASRLAFSYAPRIFVLLFLFGSFAATLSIVYGAKVVSGTQTLAVNIANGDIASALFNFLIYDLILSMLNPLFFILTFVTYIILKKLVLPAANFYTAALSSIGFVSEQEDAILAEIEQNKKSYLRILAIPFAVFGIVFVASQPIMGNGFIVEAMTGALKQDDNLPVNWIKATTLISAMSFLFIFMAATIATIWLTARSSLQQKGSPVIVTDAPNASLLSSRSFGHQPSGQRPRAFGTAK